MGNWGKGTVGCYPRVLCSLSGVTTLPQMVFTWGIGALSLTLTPGWGATRWKWRHYLWGMTILFTWYITRYLNLLTSRVLVSSVCLLKLKSRNYSFQISNSNLLCRFQMAPPVASTPSPSTLVPNHYNGNQHLQSQFISVLISFNIRRRKT